MNLQETLTYTIHAEEEVAVDLDGTLAMHDDSVPFDPEHIGEPIPAMVNYVKRLIKQGTKVIIFTARMHDNDSAQKKIIEDWCKQHLGQVLEVTAVKKPTITRFLDDRADHVEKNTGKIRTTRPGAGCRGPNCGRKDNPNTFDMLPRRVTTSVKPKVAKTKQDFGFKRFRHDSA